MTQITSETTEVIIEADISPTEIIPTSTELLASPSSELSINATLTSAISQTLFSPTLLKPLSSEQKACRSQYQQSKLAFEQNNNLDTLLAMCLAGDALNVQMQSIWEKPAHRAHLNMLTRCWDNYLRRATMIESVAHIDAQLVHLSRTMVALMSILQGNTALFMPTDPLVQAMTSPLHQAYFAAIHEHHHVLAQRQALVLEHQLQAVDLEYATSPSWVENHASWIIHAQAALKAHQQQLTALDDNEYIQQP